VVTRFARPHKCVTGTRATGLPSLCVPHAWQAVPVEKKEKKRVAAVEFENTTPVGEKKGAW
jgi:hypothetical protein